MAPSEDEESVHSSAAPRQITSQLARPPASFSASSSVFVAAGDFASAGHAREDLIKSSARRDTDPNDLNSGRWSNHAHILNGNRPHARPEAADCRQIASALFAEIEATLPESCGMLERLQVAVDRSRSGARDADPSRCLLLAYQKYYRTWLAGVVKAWRCVEIPPTATGRVRDWKPDEVRADRR